MTRTPRLSTANSVIPATESSAWHAREQRSAERSPGRDFAGARHVTVQPIVCATAFSVALCAAATTVRAQDGATSASSAVRAAIGRDAARLAEAAARRTTWQEPLPPDRTWGDRHSLAAGPFLRSAAGTMWQPQAVQQERTWVGRHPALTGALLGAGVGATYAYRMCRGACEGQPGLYMTIFGGIGAGIGAGTGAIVGVLRR